MPIRVIYFFKMVNIKHDDRGGSFCGGKRLKLRFRFFYKVTAIISPGQAIGKSNILKLGEHRNGVFKFA